MRDGLVGTLLDVQRGPVARLVLADIVALAEREGILDRARKLVIFSLDDLCAALETDLGYALAKGNRRRMISLLLGLLREMGAVTEADGAWRWGGEPTLPQDGVGPGATHGNDASPPADDQYRFFRRCLDCAPAYLRGGGSAVRFDDQHTGAWERFLGCEEFRSCRVLLLEYLGLDEDAAPRILDLCYGPGWGVEAVLARFSGSRVTALDFTDAFRERAQARAEAVQERHRRDGRPAHPVVWVGADRWQGFGQPLPFPDGSFEMVFFTCGDPYIPHRLRPMVYRDVARVLVPGGRLGVLTRCRPDAAGRHASPLWLRIAALAHDFAESVCEGWEGFAEAGENARMFAEAGFQGGIPPSKSMSALESSLWVLRTTRADG